MFPVNKMLHSFRSCSIVYKQLLTVTAHSQHILKKEAEVKTTYGPDGVIFHYYTVYNISLLQNDE